MKADKIPSNISKAVQLELVLFMHFELPFSSSIMKSCCVFFFEEEFYGQICPNVQISNTSDHNLALDPFARMQAEPNLEELILNNSTANDGALSPNSQLRIIVTQQLLSRCPGRCS